MFVGGALVLFTLYVFVGGTLVLFTLFVFVGRALVLFTLFVLVGGAKFKHLQQILQNVSLGVQSGTNLTYGFFF